MKRAETKYYDRGVENVQLYHNLGRGAGVIPPTTVTSIPELFNIWQDINQGTGRYQRVGDETYARGMKINLYIANKYDRSNTSFRIIVAVLPKAFGGLVTPYDFFPFQEANSGSLGNNMLLPADKDKGVKFLYDRIHHMSGAQSLYITGQKEMTFFKSLWIKPKRGSKIRYDTTSSTIQNKPIAVYVIPYEQYGTLTTSNVASCAAFVRLYYKDC